MEENKVHFRHLMLFYFRKRKNAAQTAKKICAIYGNGTVAESTVRKWFARFRSDNFDLEDRERSGRPAVVDDDQIVTLIENNPRHTTRDIAEILHISHMSVVRHLETLGYVNRYDVWVPHDLTERNLMDRISVSDSLLKRNENDPFLERTITGDEKWIVYNNVQERKRSWGKRNETLTTPKDDLYPKKVMLCIWWDWKGVVYYELLPHNQTLNSDKYCSQLDQLKAAIDEKRPELVNQKGVVFHQHNVRSHISLQSRQKLVQLGWDVLPHPPYSPDLAPSDYHLFRVLQKSLNGKSFNSLEDCKNHLDQFIAEKDAKFWENGIMKLPERWRKVVEQNGTYVVE
ncbi:PREDICTED: histone-lysine N-methyltransferase SETMAR-like [Trachymyrmex cornetzi]|uniref:histone-lysine N-methyltransferase SETMAR-like n=1 Tax=Trachymyrmex cornetzi TaxID=471704 RepID=UPI00084F5E5A|nr:PREDICTED: histone-lysine N-methyltransferase SETMAR-like [Trachymyrmex cornetzi]